MRKRKFFVLRKEDYIKLIVSGYIKKILPKVRDIGFTWMHPAFFNVERLITFIECHTPEFLHQFTRKLRLLNLKIFDYYREKYFKDRATMYIDYK